MLSLFVVLVLGVFAQQTYADEPEAIVGGTRAEPGEIPYQVSLREHGIHMCGGTLISSTKVATAAHCLFDLSDCKDLTVAYGTLSILGGEKRKVKSCKIHPNYDPDRMVNDVAILSLEEPVEFNNYVQPLELSTEKPTEGTECLLSGWGKMGLIFPPSPHLLKVKVKTVDKKTCEGYHGVGSIFDSQVCTLIGRGVGACMGDSGGPLVCNNKLCGVVSWGVACARGVPDVFTDISHPDIYNFILSHVSK